MSACEGCCPPPQPSVDPRFRAALWIALAVNAAMFVVEVGVSIYAGSASVFGDAVDFLGDAANYALSLFVLSLAAVWRSRAAMVKGWSMAIYGCGVLVVAAYTLLRGFPPDPMAMGVVGVIALLANVSVAFLLYRFRNGESNMRSVWLCSRNDAIGNVAILLAALGVFGTGSAWPDAAVAAVMAFLALSSGIAVVHQAHGELRQVTRTAMPSGIDADGQ